MFSDYRKWDLNTPDILIGSTLQHHVCFGKKCLELLSFINWLIKILIGLDSAKVLYITMCFQVSENWLKGCTARHFSWSAQRRSTVIPFWFGKNNKINPFLNFFFSNVGYRCRRSDTVATDLQGQPRYDNVHLLDFFNTHTVSRHVQDVTHTIQRCVFHSGCRNSRELYCTFIFAYVWLHFNNFI